jgi:hypothetical protein
MPKEKTDWKDMRPCFSEFYWLITEKGLSEKQFVKDMENRIKLILVEQKQEILDKLPKNRTYISGHGNNRKYIDGWNKFRQEITKLINNL